MSCWFTLHLARSSCVVYLIMQCGRISCLRKIYNNWYHLFSTDSAAPALSFLYFLSIWSDFPELIACIHGVSSVSILLSFAHLWDIFSSGSSQSARGCHPPIPVSIFLQFLPSLLPAFFYLNAKSVFACRSRLSCTACLHMALPHLYVHIALLGKDSMQTSITYALWSEMDFLYMQKHLLFLLVSLCSVLLPSMANM